MDNKKERSKVSEKTMKMIGQNINTALALKDIKQKDLADKLHITDNTVSFWCSGKRTPNSEQIIQIADILEVSTDYLLGLTEYPTTDKDLQFVCDYTGLSEKAIKNITKFTKAESYYDDDFYDDYPIDDEFLFAVKSFFEKDNLIFKLCMILSEINYNRYKIECLQKGIDEHKISTNDSCIAIARIKSDYRENYSYLYEAEARLHSFYNSVYDEYKTKREQGVFEDYANTTMDELINEYLDKEGEENEEKES